MQTNVDINALINASKSQLVDFKFIPADPVSIPDISFADYQTINKAVERYEKFGFVIVDLESETPTADTILKLGIAFNLGDVFVPPLYTKGEYRTANISEISTKDEQKSHPAFQREGRIELHCDGTLQSIGYIKTSILLCESPGSKGGDNILFNATAAFAELLVSDHDAAIAMATPGSLVRQANINGCSDKNIGPVFAVEDGKIICAYSITKTDKFVAANGIKASDLRRGVEFMKRASKPGSPYFHQFLLKEKQAIIFANSRISHGRTPYCNSSSTRRCLYRGIFLKPPKATKD